MNRVLGTLFGVIVLTAILVGALFHEYYDEEEEDDS